ncbi:hypothetical protein LTS18_008190, partial [Coniosporium uncinatum]
MTEWRDRGYVPDSDEEEERSLSTESESQGQNVVVGGQSAQEEKRDASCRVNGSPQALAAVSEAVKSLLVSEHAGGLADGLKSTEIEED